MTRYAYCIVNITEMLIQRKTKIWL